MEKPKNAVDKKFNKLAQKIWNLGVSPKED